jgi:hypothetical protein
MPSSGTNGNRTVVRGLGEIALRVNIMQRCYEKIIDLPLMARVPNFAFFKMADGYGGHTKVLAFSTSHRHRGIAEQTPALSALPP